MIEKINQLKPVDVIRDQYGFWVHPEYQNYWNINFGEGVDFCTDSQWEKLEIHLSIDTKVVELPYMDGNDDYDMSLISDQVINNLKPDGEGWFIFSIHECNDGPVAWWAKPKNALPEAVIESLKEMS